MKIKHQWKSERVIRTGDAPEAIRQLAGDTEFVLVRSTPAGDRYRFVLDGAATMVPPAHIPA